MTARARVLPPTPDNLALAAEALRRGELVGMPTETVYGLAGNVFDPVALARIFDVKDRPTFDPLIVHVALSQRARRCADLDRLGLVDSSALSEAARSRGDLLMDRFWPGPLTLVLPKKSDVPDLATSGLPSVGIRMPDHAIAQALIAQAGLPLAAPSANRFGRISPTNAQAVVEELGDRIDFVLDGGPCRVGVESTVLGLEPDGTLKLLRPGGVPAEEIERVCGLAPGSLQPASLADSKGRSAPSPGMLESHYAPAKPFIVLPSALDGLSDDELLELAPAGTALGILMQSGDAQAASERVSRLSGASCVVEVLSASGDLAEAARNLFAAMRRLDASAAESIFAEPCPNPSTGLGHAIADRLRRAGAKRKDLFSR